MGLGLCQALVGVSWASPWGWLHLHTHRPLVSPLLRLERSAPAFPQLPRSLGTHSWGRAVPAHLLAGWGRCLCFPRSQTCHRTEVPSGPRSGSSCGCYTPVRAAGEGDTEKEEQR